eukprot:1653700-Lingulodinium_polyedra.AAC.1
MDCIASLPPLAWDRLQQLYHAADAYEACVLQSDVMVAAFVSLAFLQHRVLDHLASRPWSLAAGNIEANLQALGAEPGEPEDQVTQRIKALLVLGAVPLQTLVDAVGLFKQ